MKGKRGFASDNNAGVHPGILAAMSEVNEGHAVAYGNDPVTQRALDRFKATFGQDTETFFVFTGTAANVLGISAAARSHQAVLCPETAHINVDECGAPEKFSGSKLLSFATPDGKLTVDMLRPHLHALGVEHHVQPKIVSITQATEMGTLYSLEEIRTLADFAHTHEMLLHMDGARIANAAAAMDLSFRELTREAGVDILSFGGTKNGMMYGEAVVFFHPSLAQEFKYIRKQGMQLASKMRYISAQFLAYLDGDLWLHNARHANAMGAYLARQVRDIPGVVLTQEPRANAVFARIPGEIIPSLQQEFFFYVWDETTHEVRWMCSFDTTREDVEEFAALLRSRLGS
ncbi:MAG: low specificity L-threonine aldolase [Bacteroidales bacterium]